MDFDYMHQGSVKKTETTLSILAGRYLIQEVRACIAFGRFKQSEGNCCWLSGKWDVQESQKGAIENISCL